MPVSTKKVGVSLTIAIIPSVFFISLTSQTPAERPLSLGRKGLLGGEIK